ncbi:MAG: hypothetical protein QF415_14420 [Candidatus Undinarchaeales archaeon]|jgi:O-phosphoseryl-tRNA(Cys) synthetase|nr:hypothetical protein [Candidatus Undinarchaeales archaeon]MDP7493187.1 hypothetical protein [Candidatus Undinarchaeales archaeon]
MPFDVERLRGRAKDDFEGTRLLGPDAHNRLVVRDGSIRAVPEWDDTADAVTALAAVRAERDLKDEGEVMVQVRMVKSASDVNVTLDPRACEFIRGKEAPHRRSWSSVRVRARTQDR